MKPYTEVEDRWSFMNPDLPNPAVGGYRGALQFAGVGAEQLRVPDADRHLLRQHRSAPGRRLQPQRPTGAARRLRHHVLAARRRRRTRRRAQRHRHARLLGQRDVSRARTGSRRPTTGTTACPRIRRRPSSIPRSTPASSPAVRTGGGVTYGDPEIGGRPPRYQNWNAGLQYALTSTMTVGAAYAGSSGDFLGGSRPRLLRQPARSALSRAGQPPHAAGDRGQHRRGAGDRVGRRACRTRTSRARSRRCCGRSRSTRA